MSLERSLSLTGANVSSSSLVKVQSDKQNSVAVNPEQRSIIPNSSLIGNDAVSEEKKLVAPCKKHVTKSRSVGLSETFNSSLLSQPTSEERQAVANDQPPCTVGEKVMVDTPNGKKFAEVKFVGSTRFASGEWIGVAFQEPIGEYMLQNLVTVCYCHHILLSPYTIVTIYYCHHIGKNNGTVEGIKYFDCKDKHGLFVRREKIIRDPTSNLQAL